MLRFIVKTLTVILPTGDRRMLSIFGDRRSRACDGTNRRDFLKVGALGGRRDGLALAVGCSRPSRTERPISQRHFGRLAVAGGRPDARRDL